jgi:hypothetical protein
MDLGLGLYMIKFKSGLFIILAGFPVLSSCIKTPIDELDKPASIQEVQKALISAWGEADPVTMSTNDFLFQETEQKIDSSQTPIFVLQEGITISKKEELPEEFSYTFLYQNRVIKQGEEGKQSTREDHRSVSKPKQSLKVNTLSEPSAKLRTMADDYQMTLGFERLYGLAYACVKTDSIDKYCKETLGYDSCEIECSNLTTSRETKPVPELIKAQPNCGGYANCSYQLDRVSFDWTISLKKGESVEKQRVNYAVAMSPDMPFLSRLSEYCFRQLYPVQNQKVLVTTCTKLKNFKRGGT